MKRILLSILGFVLFVMILSANVGLAEVQAADSAKPLVRVAFSGYDELVRNADFIGQLAGMPELASKLEDQVAERLKIDHLAGLDKSRPWGAVLQSDEALFFRYVFIPVTDLGQFLESIEPLVGKPVDVGNGVSEVLVRDMSLYVQEKNGWAFFADMIDTFEKVPLDPSKSTADLLQTYDVGLQVSVANIPPMLRQLGLVGLQMEAEKRLTQMKGISKRDRHLQILFLRQAIRSLNRTLSNTETIQLGLSIDREKSLGIVDFTSVLLENASVDRRLAQIEPIDSPLAGLMSPDAVSSLNSTMQLSENVILDLSSTLLERRNLILNELRKEGLNPAEKKRANEMIDPFVELIQETLDAGRVDFSLAFHLNPDGNTFVVGLQIADPAKLEKHFTQIAQKLTVDNPEAAKNIQLNVGEHLGVRFHSMSVSSDELGLDRWKESLGNSHDIVLGFDKKHIYLSSGRQPMETLEKALEEARSTGSQPTLPFHLVIHASNIARYAAAIYEGEAQDTASEIADLLEQSNGKDRITISGRSTGNGLNVRLEFQEGLLKLIGSVPALTPSE